MNVDPDNIFYIVNNKNTSKIINKLLETWKKRGYELTNLYYVNYQQLDKLIISKDFLENNQYQVLVIYTNNKVLPVDSFIELRDIYNIGMIFIGNGLNNKEEIIYIEEK